MSEIQTAQEHSSSSACARHAVLCSRSLIRACTPCAVLVLQVQDVYRLLVDSSPVLRRAAAGLVAGLLEELGQRAVVQVKVFARKHCTSLIY